MKQLFFKFLVAFLITSAVVLSWSEYFFILTLGRFTKYFHNLPIGTDMLTDFVSGFLARRALSKREQKQNNVLLFWDKAQRAKKVVNISLPIY